MKHLNEYFSLIIQFQSFQFFTLTPVETQMLPSEERRRNFLQSKVNIEGFSSWGP